MLYSTEVYRSRDGEWYGYGGTDVYRFDMTIGLLEMNFETVGKTELTGDTRYRTIMRNGRSGIFTLVEVSPSDTPRGGYFYFTTTAFGNDPDIKKITDDIRKKFALNATVLNSNDPRAKEYLRILNQTTAEDLEENIPILKRIMLNEVR